MPTRPSQTSAARLLRWQERRKLVGGRIRELRLQRNLTQESLALRSGLDRGMVVRIEQGKKSLAYERLWDIAEALGVRVEDLILESAAQPAKSVVPSDEAAHPGH